MLYLKTGFFERLSGKMGLVFCQKKVALFLLPAFLLIAGFVIPSCKKPYNPSAINSPGTYLVIEGVINSGNDSTVITITHTVNLSQVAADSVAGAIVTVEDNQGGSVPLIAQKKGIYVSPGLVINKTLQYRLRVKTTDNQVYLSDFESVITTPPIDSAGFKIQNGGLGVFVNTHDPANTVKYYRWSYTEAWQFHAYYFSTVMLEGRKFEPRTEDQELYFCYGNDISSDIPLSSTANLSQPVLSQKIIATVPSYSEKLETRYGILIKQYALSPDAYNFYSLLEKNSAHLGSIFDAQPSQSPGNIHCITSTQPVIGYICVSNVTSKKAFISNNLLPSSWIAAYPSTCIMSPIPPVSLPGVIDTYNQEYPNQSFEFINSDTAGTRLCVDCTIRGDRTAPPFWEN